ncbi:MAG: cupin domain-containing protein [bacterium]
MRIAKNDIPVKIDIPGAKARQMGEFGDSTGFGVMGAEFFSLGKGTDITPLLQGLKGDLCQCPHWGYLIEGELTITFADDSQDLVHGGDLFYWPPGHTVRADEDSEIILFSPAHEHGQVIKHLQGKLGG